MYQEKEITPMLVFAIFSATLGMFQFGFNTGVMNAPQKVLEEYISNVYKNRTGNWISEELRDILWSIVVSVFAIGGMIGGILAPYMANCCGRKTGLVLNNTVAVLGVTLMSSSQLSQSIESLVAGRFFIGLNCGLNTALVPMYLTEISTVNVRGALGTVSQLGVTLGLLFSQVLGLKELLGTNEHWPFLFAFAFIPATLQLIMLPFCPESPRYLLLTCGRLNDARIALRRLRNDADIEIDIEEMRAEGQAQHEEVSKHGRLLSIKDLFNHPWLRTPLLIGIMMQLSQQLSGINAILYYSTDIFLSAEVPEIYAVYATIGVGAIMVVMALVSIPLMDRVGRRTLHLYGLAGMFLASIFLTISLLVKFLYDWMKYISVISILFYTLFFGIGPSSIPWMITAELFTQDTRPTAMSVAVLVNWLTNFAVGLTFPLMKRVLQSYLFLPFTMFLAIFWIFTYKKLPETKNRTFEEIASIFRPVTFGGSAGLAEGEFGCAISDLACIGENHTATGCSSGTPNIESTGLEHDHSNIRQAHGNRFRFDAASLDHTMRCSDHDRNIAGCRETVTQFYRPTQNRRIHGCSSTNLPHNSCTSIALNLSTNDQQPLIGDEAHLFDQHKGKNQIFQQHRGSLSSSSQLQNSSTLNKRQFCQRTTSFMAGQNQDDCKCCGLSGHRGSIPHLNSVSGIESGRNRYFVGALPIDDDDDDTETEDVGQDLFERKLKAKVRLYSSSSNNNLNYVSQDQPRFLVATNLEDCNQRL